MKRFIVAIFLALIQLSLAHHCPNETQQQKQEHAILNLRLFFDQCAVENGVTQDEVDRFLIHDLTVNSREVQLFFTCIAQRLGKIDSKANVNVVNTKKFYVGVFGDDETKVDNAIADCKDKEGTDAVNRAWNIYVCYVEHGL